MGAGGLYQQTACESSPHKNQIDTWLNEGISAAEISRRLLANYGEKISDRSVMKYKKYREEHLRQELREDPVFQGKMEMVTEKLNTGIGKIREVDILGRLGTIIEDSAEMLADAKDRQIQVRNAQDFRFVSQTMLDAIKVYGDTMLKVQKMDAINQNPELLKPTQINVNVKSALVDILSGAMGAGDYTVIDQLRAGMGMDVPGNVIDVDSKELGAVEDGDNE